MPNFNPGDTLRHKLLKHLQCKVISTDPANGSYKLEVTANNIGQLYWKIGYIFNESIPVTNKDYEIILVAGTTNGPIQGTTNHYPGLPPILPPLNKFKIDDIIVNYLVKPTKYHHKIMFAGWGKYELEIIWSSGLHTKNPVGHKWKDDFKTIDKDYIIAPPKLGCTCGIDKVYKDVHRMVAPIRLHDLWCDLIK